MSGVVLAKAKTISCLIVHEILAYIAIVHWSSSTACRIIGTPGKGKEDGAHEYISA